MRNRARDHATADTLDYIALRNASMLSRSGITAPRETDVFAPVPQRHAFDRHHAPDAISEDVPNLSIYSLISVL